MKKIIYLFILSLVMPLAVFAMDNSEKELLSTPIRKIITIK